jgi:hypothetical protein
MELNFTYSYGESCPVATVAAMPILSKRPLLDA